MKATTLHPLSISIFSMKKRPTALKDETQHFQPFSNLHRLWLAPTHKQTTTTTMRLPSVTNLVGNDIEGDGKWSDSARGQVQSCLRSILYCGYQVPLLLTGVSTLCLLMPHIIKPWKWLGSQCWGRSWSCIYEVQGNGCGQRQLLVWHSQ